MNEDDEICLCFHVTRRKLVNFVRVERPQRESQMADCQGAGTGCGWCRPFLEQIFRAETGSDFASEPIDTISPTDYAARRKKYRGNNEEPGK